MDSLTERDRRLRHENRPARASAARADVAALVETSRRSLDQLRDELIADRGSDAHWTGTLSASALSTATAVSAFAAAKTRADLVQRGVAYLRSAQNDDGGFGDTDRSHSNIATSYLVLAASELARQFLGDEAGLSGLSMDNLRRYLREAGELDGLRRRYGKDKTFVVPIMTNMAIAGLVEWKQIPELPFEAAVFPQSMYRFLRMPVVSYAVPALVAMGQARYLLGPKPWPPLRQIRRASIDRTMKVLRQMQPHSGGYLEATPLTAFVVMSLAATGRGDGEVARQGLRFLAESMTEDGSWPIDTNLATWVTSLSMLALTKEEQSETSWCTGELLRWHLACQHRQRHPFTGAEPGGWGWTNLSGAVPDGDDTPAAILALCRTSSLVADPVLRKETEKATEAGVRWLLKLQNRNGGWPTFCRGWGKLPFDRSSTDLTAHAIRAIWAWQHVVRDRQASDSDAMLEKKLDKAVRRGTDFLRRQQRDDGSWLPLWFGNQDHVDDENAVYGTSRVLMMFAASDRQEPTAKATRFLCEQQNPDGGWGGGDSVTAYNSHGGVDSSVVSTLEETGLAVEALAEVILAMERDQFHGSNLLAIDPADVITAIIAGVKFLVHRIHDRAHHHPWPIGFYFAKLWYHERLYPIVFAAAALGAFQNVTRTDVWQSDLQA